MLLLATLLAVAAPPAPAVVAVPDTTTLETVRRGDVASGRDSRGGFYAWFTVPAPVERVYNVLSDDAAMSTWIPRLTLSAVQAEQPPCRKVAFSVPTPIGEVKYTLDRCRDGQRIWWGLAEGEQFEDIAGAYDLRNFESGTLVYYWSRVVGRVPVPEWAQAEAGRIGVSGLVDGLRAEVVRRGG